MFVNGRFNSAWRATIATAFILCASSIPPSAWAQDPQSPQSSMTAREATPQPPLPATLDQLETDPARYLNRRVTVRAEVEDVLGPRLFKIDERNWADLDPEVLVAVNAPLAVLVKEDDQVTITGTMRPFASVELDREWGWLDPAPELEARIRGRHVLVADTVTGWDDDTLLTISTIETPATTTGTSGTSGTTGAATPDRPSKGGGETSKASGADSVPIADLPTLTRSADNRLVGRPVKISAKVARTDRNGGFWVESADGHALYVLPADDVQRVQTGQSVNIAGHVMRMPEHMEEQLEKSDKVGNEEIYVYATAITRH